MGQPIGNILISAGYVALFKTGDNSALSSSMIRMSDGNGNDAPLWMSLTSLNNRGAGNQQQNSAFGENSLISNTTGIGNCAYGLLSGSGITTAVGNSIYGANASQIGNGSYNTVMGNGAMGQMSGDNNVSIGAGTTALGSDSTVIGTDATSGSFSGSVVLGRQAQASANNQFVVGSSSVNAGVVTAESLSPVGSWTVRINGFTRKILLG